MDPEKDAKLKDAATALAYQVYGFLTAINTAAAGFDAGLRAVEQAHGRIPVALPTLTGAKADKKSRDPRRTRPALRPSGGSGTHQVPAPVAGLGSPTMLALLEDLNKELHGAGNGGEREAEAGDAAAAAQRGPLVTPTGPEAATATATGRLSDAAPLTEPTPPEAPDSAGHMDSDEGEVRGSNEGSEGGEAKGDGSGGGGAAAEGEPLKADPEFSFDPAMVNSVRKSRRASPAPLTGSKAAKRSRRTSPAEAEAAAQDGEDFAFPTTAPGEN